jgi:hypothetical protein
VSGRLGGVQIGGADESYDNKVWIDELRGEKWPVIEEIELREGLKHYLDGRQFVLRYVDPPTPAARARPDEIVRAYDEWWPRRHRQPRGIRSTERKRDAAF